ncbi:ABC transporter ATP-binding protein/permease [Falsiroseomonas oryziterrae]|uniref:ABC transporter ATP-binding protein/permease n=1 Tax=Falsiroseomonas oryziterrae TaxID=2911368 RepID=UPI001F29ECC2|nr:ABC transporter ATP-binding protein/permease [Roseomonas sp. NPKOSM-4]
MPKTTTPQVEQNALSDAWRLARGWARDEPWVVAGLVAAALLAIGAQLAVDWGFALWNRHAFDALEARDGAAFGTQMLVFAGLIAALMVASVGRLWTRQILGFRWRRWLVLRLQDRMLVDGRHHRLASGATGTDNPDQRIGENARWATAIAVDLAFGLIYAVVLLASFAGMLWHLSAAFFIPVGDTRLHVPGGMLWAALLYAAGCAAITFWLGRRLPAIHMQRNTAEGDHRFALVRLREHSEAIALMGGERDERRGLAAAYARLEAAMLRMFRSERDLMWLGCCYMAVAHTLPLALGAPSFFAGAVTLGVLMQTAHAFMEVTRALTWLTENWPRLADWRCHVARVVELERALEAPEPPGALRRQDGAPALELRGIALATPCGRDLLRAAEVTVSPGERVLIRGESGSGKSTLFRAMAGLWSWGQGEIRMPCRQASMFLPQRPYLPLGTLAAALCYPAAPGAFGAEALEAALRRCNLPHLAGRLEEEEARWDRVLSLGEQQRLAFARVLLHRPLWIFMDEATSALDEANQAAMFALLAEELPGSAVLSIGHRPGLGRHHDRELVVQPSATGGRLLLPAAGAPTAPPRPLPRREAARGQRIRAAST